MDIVYAAEAKELFSNRAIYDGLVLPIIAHESRDALMRSSVGMLARSQELGLFNTYAFGRRASHKEGSISLLKLWRLHESKGILTPRGDKADTPADEDVAQQ